MFVDGHSLVRAAWLLGPLMLSGCLSVREEARPDQNECASCHGDPERAVDALLQAAPPRDLLGNASPAFPGVGAHEAHLSPSETHGGVACSECHALPERTDSPGHADTATPAEVSFGTVAQGGGEPAYDAVARRCADTYCHGARSPIWTEPAQEPCGGCHALPPPAPHPQSERCAACHGEVIDLDRHFIAPARHVDGRVDLGALACEACHGSAESAAPPPALDGETQADRRGVGAHSAHLAGGGRSRPLACSECHPLPGAEPSLSHPEGGATSVVFTGAASAGERAPAWDAQQATCAETWCHGPSSAATRVAEWTRAAPLACDDCHGMPPAAPHPQVDDCGLCHAEVYASAEAAIAHPQRHVDGVVDVQVPGACTGCHGSGAAEPGSGGVTASAAPDLGAHAVHLVPRGPARPVACDACHAVPAEVFSAGHVDTPAPAEVAFSGVATSFEARPQFSAGNCADTYCHGDSFIGGRPSGGVDTRPSWTTPAATSALTCQSCHGMPPPPPHPSPADDCSSCHRNVDGSQAFIAPATHVDGVVTFFLP